MLPSIATDIRPMSEHDIDIANQVGEYLKNFDNPTIETKHTIHGGIYTRTIMVKKGMTIVGVIIKVPTTIIVSGKCSFFIGEKVIHLEGVHVLAASAMRKQVLTAHEDTSISMILTTDADNLKDAEDTFTDEGNMLFSREDRSINTLNITGE